MKLCSRKMTRELALNVLSWHYDPPYDFYYNQVTEEAISELVNDGYMAVEDEKGELLGFYCSGRSAQVPAGRAVGVYTEYAIDIGVGMHPELTGKGNGSLFLSLVLNELKPINSDVIFRLTVAKFNIRAIKLYENLGFKKMSEIKSDTHDFIIMLKW
ncbi:GNAT family N-acetyltransferase [Mesobacillus subterraneus]|uniref:GNAT family N-acetyltransferase n=1 Tax=Mesobacillus subterraneus TaxID=285983 RepID=UPI001CFDCE6B|nr:GNAT family N-acetyltransferase [Mesobacillus subterraneus]WLR56959.1 GNAT family N-acetyltransferase [Mesobacillus subterraneus]